MSATSFNLDHGGPEYSNISTAFVGRQPIYSRELETLAYELLFRCGEQNQAVFDDGDQATAELILNTFAEIGLERVVGPLPAFVNVPENFLLSGHGFALPKDRVVLEVLEDVKPTPQVLKAVTKLREAGYSIAIDDFVYTPELLPLVELANIVKVDLPSVSKTDLAEHVEILRNFDVRLLAEKVETHEEFEYCKELNFDYFQGYFFCKPTIVKGKKLPINRIALVRLIAQLKKPSASLSELSEIVRTEPSLSFKLLRFVNSAYCGLSAKVESVKHAVALAGIQRIKTMCCLSLLTKVSKDKSLQLIQLILVRARMAELLAERLRQVRTDSYFLVGLFSAIDALLDVPMEEALELVPVSAEVKRALTEQTGVFGMVLRCVLEYERGNWDEVKCHTLEKDVIRNIYLEAIEWASGSLNENL